jgi:hypothetical protein
MSGTPTGALTPPATQLRENYDRTTLATLWAFTCVALALILTRLVWRYRRREKFALEDIWMASSIAPLLLRLAFIHISLVSLTAYFDRKTYKQEYMAADEIQDRELGSKMILPGRVCYAGFLWMMKVVILLWFEKVTGKVWPYGIAIKGAYFFVAATFVGVVLATFLECQPVKLYWQVFPDPGKCIQAKAQLLTMGTMNMCVSFNSDDVVANRESATDICLMIIPLPLVIGARLPILRKLQLIILFSVSMFVVAITVIRMPVIIGNRTLQKSRTLWASIGTSIHSCH